jgi:stage V sporulation protein G
MKTTITVRNLRAVQSRTVYALLDADIVIAGVVITVVGIQARHVPAGGTSVHLPTYRDSDGAWRAAVILPEEIREALSDAVLSFMVEEGVAKARVVATNPSDSVQAAVTQAAPAEPDVVRQLSRSIAQR